MIEFSNVYNFLKTVYRWIQSGGQLVPLEEAVRRSEICLTCPMNRAGACRGRCPSCFARVAYLALFGWFESTKNVTHKELIPVSENPHSDKLFCCTACGCYLTVKVFIPSEVLSNKGVKYPKHCWQNPITEGPPPE